MGLISENDRAAISKLFEDTLVGPVKIVYFTIPSSPLVVPGRATCETCDDVQKLVEEVADISDKLSIEVHNFERERDEAARYGVSRVPALILSSADEARVRYFGAPAGYEFSTLIQDIQSISKNQTALTQATREALAAIQEPIHLQVFVTPT